MGLQISVDEGHALEVLDLLCRGRAVRIAPEEAITRPRPELVEVAARRLGVLGLRFLVDGGRRERTLLRGGRRSRGRIWERERCGDFRLRFTAATYGLWTELTPRFASLARDAHVEVSGGASRWARRQIRRVVKVTDTDTGDWLVYALAAEHLRRSALPEEISDDLRRRLALGSPLALLVTLDDRAEEDSDEVVGSRLDRLLDPANVLLLECAEELLVDAWHARIAALPRVHEVPARILRTRAVASVLGRHLDALDRAQRLDLVAPFVALFTRLTAARGLWARPPAELVRDLGRLHEFTGLVQRDALRRAYAELVDLGPRLFDLRDRLARERYGDPRYEEAQIVLEAVEPLRPRLPRLRALAGALANRLG
ncbi:MAG: hypothetical protein R3A79_26945 [Nannocystaceae bacterium]